MGEIQSVTLDSVMISHRLLKSIAKLKKLKRLVVRECELDQDFTEADISKLRSLPIEEFTLVSGMFPIPAHASANHVYAQRIRDLQAPSRSFGVFLIRQMSYWMFTCGTTVPCLP